MLLENPSVVPSESHRPCRPWQASPVERQTTDVAVEVGSDHVPDPVDLRRDSFRPRHAVSWSSSSRARSVRFLSASFRHVWELGRLCRTQTRISILRSHVWPDRPTTSFGAYVDSTTGEVASVLVLYGLADSVFGHTPEVCYQVSGLSAVVSPPLTASFRFRTPRLRSGIVDCMSASRASASTEYSRGCLVVLARGILVARRGEPLEACFGTLPAMFKVQIQRPATGLSREELL